jgi:hypothetical protein
MENDEGVMVIMEYCVAHSGVLWGSRNIQKMRECFRVDILNERDFNVDCQTARHKNNN